MMKFKITFIFMSVAIVAIMVFSFNCHPATMPSVQTFDVNNLQASAYTPPSTTLNKTSGWVSPTTTFMLTPSGSYTSTAYAYPAEKNDQDFAGYSVGSGTTDIATVTNWSDVHTGSGYTAYLANWPQTNSWSNYSSTNTASGYNKVGACFTDSTSSNNPSANYLMPGYLPTGNTWYYYSFEVRVTANGYSGAQAYSINTMNSGMTGFGNTFQLFGNGSFGIQARYSSSTSSKTSVSWLVGTDYFVRLYFNPSSYLSYWALNGTVYNNGGNYWPWSTANIAYNYYFNLGGNNAGYGSTWYFDNFDFSWVHTFPASSWHTITSPYTFTLGSGLPDGSTVNIGYNSTGAGGVEFTHLATVQYDKNSPITTISYKPGYSASPNFVNSTTAFTLNAGDGSGSGVKSTGYAVDTSLIPQISSRTMGTVGNDVNTMTNFTDHSGAGCACDIENWPSGGGYGAYGKCIECMDNSGSTNPSFSWNMPVAIGGTAWNSVSFVIRMDTANYRYAIFLEDYASDQDIVFSPRESSFSQTIQFDNTQTSVAWAINTNYVVVIYFNCNTKTAYFSINGTTYYQSSPIAWYMTTGSTVGMVNMGGWNSGMGNMYIDNIQASWINTFVASSWHAYSTSFNVASMGNGTVYIGYNSTDNVGNVELTHLETVRLDTIAPNTTISYTPAWLPNFVTISTIFTLAGFDNAGGSGVATRFYNINSTGWIAGNSFNLGGWTNGTITIEYRSKDNVGNTEVFGTKVVRLDTIAPTTTLSYTTAWPPNFVTTSTIFTLAGFDNAGGSGLSTRYYNINGTGWVAGNSFNLGGWTSGTITITYRSTDNVGNTEVFGTKVVKLDMIAPTTGISYTAAHPPNIVNSTTQFTLIPNDNTGGSGIASTQYQYNGSGGWHVYTTQFALSSAPNGSITINYYSTDNMGNVETTRTLVVVIISNPIATSTPASAATIAPNSTFSILWTLTSAHDAGEYRVTRNGTTIVTWTSWPNNPAVITVPVNTNIGFGHFNYTIYFNDSVGLNGSPASVIITVDDLPTSNHPPDRVIVENSSIYAFSWYLQDIYPGAGYYNVYLNGSSMWGWQPFSSVANITVDTNTNAGCFIYNYTIAFYDNIGLNGTPDSVFITVNDHPRVNAPANFVVTQGQAGVSIPWIITDKIGKTGAYRVYKNGTTYVDWTSFSTGANLNIAVTTTIAGYWNFTIVYHDVYGLNGTQDSVLITVNDYPTSTSPPDVVVVANATGQQITWTLHDTIGGSGFYRIYRNGMALASWMAFVSGANVSASINTNIGLGYWNYTIMFNDTYGLYGTQDTVLVFVDNVPVATAITVSPVQFYQNTTGHSISWKIANFVGTGLYRVLRSGASYIGWTTWVNNVAIVVQVSATIGVGTWQYQIDCNDSRGVAGVPNTISVIVLPDTNGPLLGNLTTDAIKLHDAPVTIKCDAYDGQSGLKNVVLYYKPAGIFLSIVMARGAGNTYQAVVPGLPFGTIVWYYIQAMDNASNTNNLGTASNPYSYGLNFLQVGINSVEFTSPIHLHVTINVVIPGNLTLTIFNASNSLLNSLNISTELTSFDLQFTGAFSGNANLTYYYSSMPSANNILVYHQVFSAWIETYKTVNTQQGTLTFGVNSLSVFIIGIQVPSGFDFVKFLENNWLLLSITASALIVGIVAIVTVTRKKKGAVQATALPPTTKDIATKKMEAMEKKMAAMERYQKLQYVPPPGTATNIEGSKTQEQEVAGKMNVKMCFVHKGRIKGLNYSCPQCNTTYCLNCATTLASIGDGCWNCGHKMEFDEAFKAAAAKERKSGESAVFYCASCTQYYEVENPDFVAWANCPVCGKPMVYSKRCPSCNRTIAVTKELYTIHKDLPIPCPNCKKDLVF